MANLLTPLLEDRQEVLAHLPKGIRLLRSLVERLSDRQVQTHLNTGLPLQRILRNEPLEHVQRHFRQKLANRLPPALVELAFLRLHQASLNVVYLAQVFRTENFTAQTTNAYACSALLLQKLMHFSTLPPEAGFHSNLTTDAMQREHIRSLDAVQRTLCDLAQNGHLESLLELTQRAVRVDQVLAWISQLMAHLRLPKLEQQLANIQDMVAILERHSFSDWMDMLSDKDLPAPTNELRNLLQQFRQTGGGFAVAVLRLTDDHSLRILDETLVQLSLVTAPISTANRWLQYSVQPLRRGVQSIRQLKQTGLFQVQCKFA